MERNPEGKPWLCVWCRQVNEPERVYCSGCKRRIESSAGWAAARSALIAALQELHDATNAVLDAINAALDGWATSGGPERAKLCDTERKARTAVNGALRKARLLLERVR